MFHEIQPQFRSLLGEAIDPTNSTAGSLTPPAGGKPWRKYVWSTLIQDASRKWRFIKEFPTKNVITCVVTVTGWGVDPNKQYARYLLIFLQNGERLLMIIVFLGEVAHVFFLFFSGGRGILKGRSFSKQRSSTCLFKPNNDELESSIRNDRGSPQYDTFLIRHGEFSSCWLESLRWRWRAS